MEEHVRSFIRNCPCCQKLSTIDPKIIASHFSTSTNTIFDTLNVDFLGPFPDKGYILVLLILLPDGQSCYGVKKLPRHWHANAYYLILVDMVHQI